MSLTIAVLLASGASPAGAITLCSWVESVSEWHGTVSWDYVHNSGWSDAAVQYEGNTSDVGSATFTNDQLQFTTEISGSLTYDDLYRFMPAQDTPSFSHLSLDALSDDSSLVYLFLDPLGCTYSVHWEMWGSGTLSNEGGSLPVENGQANGLTSSDQPIPEAPGPLSWSGSVPARLASESPAFFTFGEGASESSYALGESQLGAAQVSWRIQPGPLTAPLDDECGGMAYLPASFQQDTSGATSSASDPASSCGSGIDSVWLFFRSETSGTARISTAGSGHGTLVSVWPKQEGCPPHTELACGSDGASLNVQAGESYLVQVQRTSASGTGMLDVEVTPEPDEPEAIGAAVLGLAGVAVRRRSAPARRGRVRTAMARG